MYGRRGIITRAHSTTTAQQCVRRAIIDHLVLRLHFFTQALKTPRCTPPGNTRYCYWRRAPVCIARVRASRVMCMTTRPYALLAFMLPTHAVFDAYHPYMLLRPRPLPCMSALCLMPAPAETNTSRRCLPPGLPYKPFITTRYLCYSPPCLPLGRTPAFLICAQTCLR